MVEKVGTKVGTKTSLWLKEPRNPLKKMARQRRTKRPAPVDAGAKVARPVRLERTTYRFEVMLMERTNTRYRNGGFF